MAISLDNFGKCKVEVNNDDMAVACDLCERWFHIKCVGITKDGYKFMTPYG